MANLLKMLWEYMDLTVLQFFETWSAHIFGGLQRVCWCTISEAFNQASPTKEFWENCPRKKGGHIYGKNEGGGAKLRKWLYLRCVHCTVHLSFSHYIHWSSDTRFLHLYEQETFRYVWKVPPFIVALMIARVSFHMTCFTSLRGAHNPWGVTIPRSWSMASLIICFPEVWIKTSFAYLLR